MLTLRQPSPNLPIVEITQRLLETLTAQKRLVLTAPTGSGKSTQVPQMLLDGGLLGDGQVMVLQPRRLPTRMLAAWVAQGRSVKLGGEVRSLVFPSAVLRVADLFADEDELEDAE